MVGQRHAAAVTMQRKQGEIPELPMKSKEDEEYERRYDELAVRKRRLVELSRDHSGLESEAYQRPSYLERAKWGRHRDLNTRNIRVEEGELEVKNEEVGFMHLMGPFLTAGEELEKIALELDKREKDLERRKPFFGIQCKYHAALQDERDVDDLGVTRDERGLAKRVARLEMLQTVSNMKFTLFPSLPIELHLRIWSFVETPYDEPRIHSI